MFYDYSDYSMHSQPTDIQCSSWVSPQSSQPSRDAGCQHSHVVTGLGAHLYSVCVQLCRCLTEEVVPELLCQQAARILFRIRFRLYQ